MKQLFLGVDPGFSGACAVVDADGNFVEVFDFSVVTQPYSRTKFLAGEAICEKINTIRNDHEGILTHALIEQVGGRPGEGVVSVFNFGAAFGGIATMLHAMTPLSLMYPQAWRQQYQTPDDGWSKDYAIGLAQSFWPDAPIGRNHNRAEALLIANVARQVYLTAQEQKLNEYYPDSAEPPLIH